jgi:hypothetical protein
MMLLLAIEAVCISDESETAYSLCDEFQYAYEHDNIYLRTIGPNMISFESTIFCQPCVK